MPKKHPTLTTFQKKLIRWLLAGSTLHGRMWKTGPSYYVRSGTKKNYTYTRVHVATIISLLNKSAIFTASQSEDKVTYLLTIACEKYCRKHLLTQNNRAMTEQKNYVELFLFSPDERRVVLQQAPQGNWTGVFGELKPGETPADAANRVFIENTNVAHRYWRPEAALQISNDGMHVTIFTAVSPNLDLVRTSNKCIVQVHEPEAAINNGMLHNTTRWVLLMCLDNLRHSHTAQIIYDGIYGQLTGIHAHVPDPAKGLKIGIVCNEYTDFNAFVVKARRLSVNDDNRFFCILSAKELYGHKFDFYYLLDPMDKLNHGALTAINSMNFQGMISDDALIEKYIKPAL